MLPDCPCGSRRGFFFFLKPRSVSFILCNVRRRIGILLILTALLSIQQSPAQKAYKPIRTALKNNKPDDALKEIKKLEGDTLYSGDPRLYAYAVQAYQKKNDALNEKAYLKQSFDTAQLFSTVYDICTYTLRLDSTDQAWAARHQKEAKTRRANSELLHRCYANLGAGGRYHYAKKKYADAVRYLSLYLTLPTLPVWGTDTATTSSRRYIDNAYLRLNSLFASGRYSEMGTYRDLLLSDTLVRRNALLCYTLAAEAVADSADFLQLLGEGLRDYPDQPLYFTRLADTYANRGAYAPLLQLSDSLLNIDSRNVYYLECKSLCLMKLERYEEAIAISLLELQADSAQAEPYYYIGACYCNLAHDVDFPLSVNSADYAAATRIQQGYYTNARPYLEHYRKLAPGKSDRWAPLLYTVYLKLNKGREFDEIDQLLRSQKSN